MFEFGTPCPDCGSRTVIDSYRVADGTVGGALVTRARCVSCTWARVARPPRARPQPDDEQIGDEQISPAAPAGP
jgi:hypothetical protein